MTNVEDSKLANAFSAWIAQALPIIAQHPLPMKPSMNFVIRDDGASGTGTQIPNWEKFVTNERTALIDLPMTGELLEIARTTPEIEQVMLRSGAGETIEEEQQCAHLFDSYLAPFTVAFLKHAAREQCDEVKAFSAIYEHLERFLFHYNDLPYSILVQFSNFRSDVLNVELEPGIRIRQATTDEQELALRSEKLPLISQFRNAALVDLEMLRYGRFQVDMDSTPYAFLEIDLIYGRDPLARPNGAITFDDGYVRSEQLLSGLHLLDNRFVVGHSLWYVDTNPFQRFELRRIDYSMRKVPASGPYGRYVLTSEHARQLQQIWPMLTRPDRDPRIDLALRRLESTYERKLNEDKILDYWIALEALFLPTQEAELSFRAALRIARYLGESHDERVEIFESVKSSYGVRSKVAHGARLRAEADLEGTVLRTGALLRRALVKALTDGQPPNVRQLDRDLLL